MSPTWHGGACPRALPPGGAAGPGIHPPPPAGSKRPGGRPPGPREGRILHRHVPHPLLRLNCGGSAAVTALRHNSAIPWASRWPSKTYDRMIASPVVRYSRPAGRTAHEASLPGRKRSHGPTFLQPGTDMRPRCHRQRGPGMHPATCPTKLLSEVGSRIPHPVSRIPYRPIRLTPVPTGPSGLGAVTDHWPPSTFSADQMARSAGPGGCSRGPPPSSRPPCGSTGRRRRPGRARSPCSGTRSWSSG